MSLKYGILSFIALGFVLLLAMKNYEIWTQPMELFPKTQKEEIKSAEKRMEPSPTALSAKETPSIQSYISIAEKNPFHPDRKDFPVPGTSSKPTVRPQVVLYGVTVAGDYQAASVTQSGRPLRKGEREIMTIKVGEKIGEYKLIQVASDRITLEGEGDRFEVLLYDPKTPKKRVDVKTDVKPATITSAVTGTQPVLGTQPVPSGVPPRTTVQSPAIPSAGIPTPPPTPPVVSPPQTTVSPPATTGPPGTPSLPIRRGRTIYTPPSGTPATGSTGNQ